MKNSKLTDTAGIINVQPSFNAEQIVSILKNAKDATAIFSDPELTVAFANDAMLKIWGENNSVDGKRFGEVLPKAGGQAFMELLRKTWSTGIEHHEHETPAEILVDGVPKTFYFDFIYKPLRDDAGKVFALLLMASEVSERMAANSLAREKSDATDELNAELMAANNEADTLNAAYLAAKEDLESANEQLYLLSEALDHTNQSLRNKKSGLPHEKASLLTRDSKILPMLADAPVAIGLLTGEELLIEAANNQLLTLWGKTDQVIGRSLRDTVPELKGQTYFDTLLQVIKTGQPIYGNEAKASLFHDGNVVDRYFNFVYQPVCDEQHEINSVMVVAANVTAQVEARQATKQADKRFELIADNISQLVWMADAKGDIFWYNQRWYDYTGSSLEEMYGWGWQKVHHPDHVKRVVDKLRHNYQTGEAWEDTFPLRRYDGEYRWFLSRAIPSRDSAGKITTWFGTNTDITDQRKLEEQKDDFISIASHELKTPLTSLRANLQLLERMKNNPTPMAPKLIDAANKSMAKINSLIDDLLNVNRLTKGKLELQKKWFNVWDMLTLCCNDVRAEQKFELKVTGDRDIEIYADEHKIEQVIVNFVNNAIKYAPHSKTIFLDFFKHDTSAKISVRDKGPGIPKKQLPHLFDRYWRANHAGQQYSGLGLGLFICAEIVHRHGGEIGVDSVVGEGSTFWFTIPQNITK